MASTANPIVLFFLLTAINAATSTASSGLTSLFTTLGTLCTTIEVIRQWVSTQASSEMLKSLSPAASLFTFQTLTLPSLEAVTKHDGSMKDKERTRVSCASNFSRRSLVTME